MLGGHGNRKDTVEDWGVSISTWRGDYRSGIAIEDDGLQSKLALKMEELARADVLGRRFWRGTKCHRRQIEGS